jgi:hypothetical protein
LAKLEFNASGLTESASRLLYAGHSAVVVKCYQPGADINGGYLTDLALYADGDFARASTDIDV